MLLRDPTLRTTLAELIEFVHGKFCLLRKDIRFQIFLVLTSTGNMPVPKSRWSGQQGCGWAPCLGEAPGLTLTGRLRIGGDRLAACGDPLGTLCTFCGACGSLRGGGGGAIHGPALTLASGSHLQTLHPSLTWEGRLCPRPWLLERPLPQMPPHRALGEGREVLKMAPGGPGGQGQLLAKAVDPGLDTAYPWACGAPSCPASSLGKLDSLPRRNRQGECY